MANSFSQQGALPTDPNYGSAASGFSLNPSDKSAFLGTSGVSGSYSPGSSNVASPGAGSTSGLFDLSQNLPSPGTHPGLLPGTKNGPLKSVTTADGTTTTYHAPAAPGGSQAPSAPASPAQGTPASYAQQVTDASQPSAVGQGAANASALYGMLGNEGDLSPFAGGKTQGLLNSYANLSRPQTTGNLAGESALFNVQNGILQGAANTSAQQALEAQKIQQSGAATNLNASLPQSISPGSSLYNPLQGSSGYDPASGATRGAAYSALGPAYGDMNQAQGTLKNIQDNTQLFNTIVPSGVNVSDATPLNQIANKLGSTFSSQAYGQFNAILPNIISQYASYIGSSKGLTPSDAFAQASREINPNSSIGTIKSVLQILSQEAGNTLSAKQKVYNDALNSFSSGTASQDSAGGQSSGSGLYSF